MTKALLRQFGLVFLATLSAAPALAGPAAGSSIGGLERARLGLHASRHRGGRPGADGPRRPARAGRVQHRTQPRRCARTRRDVRVAGQCRQPAVRGHADRRRDQGQACGRDSRTSARSSWSGNSRPPMPTSRPSRGTSRRRASFPRCSTTVQTGRAYVDFSTGRMGALFPHGRRHVRLGPDAARGLSRSS